MWKEVTLFQNVHLSILWSLWKVHTFAHISVNCSLAATSPQRQRPLKYVPTKKWTSRQQSVNKRLTTGIQNTIFLISFSFWSLFWLCNILTCYDKHWLLLHPRKNYRCHIAPVPLNSGHHSTAVTFRWTRSDRWRDVRNNIIGKIFITMFLNSNPKSIKLNPITSIGFEIWFNELRDLHIA